MYIKPIVTFDSSDRFVTNKKKLLTIFYFSENQKIIQFKNKLSNYMGIELYFFRYTKYYLADKCIELVLKFHINALFGVTWSSGIGLSTVNL